MIGVISLVVNKALNELIERRSWYVSFKNQVACVMSCQLLCSS